MSDITLSLVVPCYNEESNVEAFCDEARRALGDALYGWELVFVNDGSSDGTLERLRQLYARRDENMTIVSFSRNFGKEAAMLAGLNRARGQLMCIIDADLQQDPAIARQMADFLLEHEEYDCAAAYQAERIEGRFISACKKAFYGIINRISEIEFRSGASDFRCFRRNVADAVRALPEVSRFSKGIFSWVGFNTYYLPYTARERNAGESKWGFFKLLRYAFDGILSYTTAPLKLATYLGGGSALLAVIYLIVVVLQRLIRGVDVPGYATIVVLILFLGGMQLLILGIIGEYLARMYLQVKNRPVYIEKVFLQKDKSAPAASGDSAAEADRSPASGRGPAPEPAGGAS